MANKSIRGGGQRKQEEDEATVFVRNLPLDLLAQELEETFSEVGPVKKASVIHDKKVPGGGPQKSRGFGFVTFAVAADVDDAIRKLHGTRVRGRALSVEPCGNKKKAELAKAAAAAKTTAKAAPAKAAAAAKAAPSKAAVPLNKPTLAKVAASSTGVREEEGGSESEGADGEKAEKTEAAVGAKAKSKKANKLASAEEVEENAKIPVRLCVIRALRCMASILSFRTSPTLPPPGWLGRR
jgi:hypothetical protein